MCEEISHVLSSMRPNAKILCTSAAGELADVPLNVERPTLPSGNKLLCGQITDNWRNDNRL